ncbi:MAG: hypothetical protein AAGF24_10920 [Cyanobacteria bacterium P01_H01_bin.121]
MFKTEFDFTLPKGYFDGEGNLHRHGVMRLAKAVDEIIPMRDPRVQLNPSYATVIILSRVVVRLGLLDEISPKDIESLYVADLNYLYDLYRQLNDLPHVETSGPQLEPSEETLTVVEVPGESRQ